MPCLEPWRNSGVRTFSMRFWSNACLIIAFSGAPVWADPAATRYPIELRIKIQPSAESVRYEHEGRGGLSGPPSEQSTTFVGKQAVEAYRAVAVRLFQQGAAIALQLEIETVRPRVDLQSDGWHTIVEHGLVARDPQGAVLGRWTVEGRGRVTGLGEGAVPNAFARAAELAAQRFESQLESPPEMISWLQRAGITPGTIARRPPGVEPPLPPPAPEAGPPRARAVVYGELGLGFTTVSMQTQSGPAEGITPGFDARLGLSGRWAFVQAGFSYWSSRENELEHRVASFGLDAGPLLRLGRSVEMALGLGVQGTSTKAASYSYGPEPVWVQSFDVFPNVVAALRLTPAIRSFRMRVTLEGRLR